MKDWRRGGAYIEIAGERRREERGDADMRRLDEVAHEHERELRESEPVPAQSRSGVRRLLRRLGHWLRP